MAPRMNLQTILTTILGSSNVYFQPPAGLKMEYPCIVYKRDDVDTRFADNKPYTSTKRYQVTYIAEDPDSDVPDKIALLESCVFDRFFTANNLNHDVFKLYF